MGLTDAVSDALKLAEYSAKSDAACKNLLACKEILVKIMHECVAEYKDCTEEEIFQCIEGEPEIGTVPVERDMTGKYYADKIKGNANEDTTAFEGTVTYDIQFDARLPGTSERAWLIINIEAQNQFRPNRDGTSYSLVTRGLYYCSRMISAQKNQRFKGSHYEDVCKVYSIWVCLQPPKDWQGAVNAYSVEEHQLFGTTTEDKENYDKLCVILLCLGENDTAQQSKVVDLLNTLLSNKYSKEQKEALLKDRHGMTPSDELERGINEMCDYSSYVKETSRAEGRAEGAEDATIALIRNAMKNMKVAADKAMDILGIPQADRDKYRAMLN